MTRPPALAAVVAVAAVLCGAGGTARARNAARAAQRNERVDEVFRSVLGPARAGAADGRTSDDELGVIAAADISPDGRRLVAVDEIPPNVKLIGGDGNVALSLHFDHDTAAPYVAPVVAVSNTRLLVLRRDLGRAEVFDDAGRLVQRIDGLDFVPETVTALTDTTWLAYGRPRDGIPGAGWLHCLYAPTIGRPRWDSVVIDTMGSEHTRMPPTLNVSRDGLRVRVAAFDGTSAAWNVSCGARPGLARAERVAVAPGERGHALELVSVALLDDAILTMRMRPAAVSFESAARADSTVVGLRWRAESSLVVIVGADYRIFAHRAGVGVLIGTSSPVPRLYVARDEALVRAMKGLSQ